MADTDNPGNGDAGPTIPAAEPSLRKRFHLGVHNFIQYFKDGAWSEIGIRVAIFVMLTFLVHTVLVWSIYSMLIPILQTMVMDAALEEAKKHLEKVEWNAIFKEL